MLPSRQVLYTEQQQGWMARRADASSWRPSLRGHPGLTLRTVIAATGGRVVAVRPEGADHLWRRIPPGELSIDPVADERLGRVTGRAGAS